MSQIAYIFNLKRHLKTFFLVFRVKIKKKEADMYDLVVYINGRGCFFGVTVHINRGEISMNLKKCRGIEKGRKRDIFFDFIFVLGRVFRVFVFSFD